MLSIKRATFKEKQVDIQLQCPGGPPQGSSFCVDGSLNSSSSTVTRGYLTPGGKEGSITQSGTTFTICFDDVPQGTYTLNAESSEGSDSCTIVVGGAFASLKSMKASHVETIKCPDKPVNSDFTIRGCGHPLSCWLDPGEIGGTVIQTGNAWRCSFTNVPPGVYFITVQFPDGTDGCVVVVAQEKAYK
jgi:hypothetical protein